jgi:hypothetical protein
MGWRNARSWFTVALGTVALGAVLSFPAQAQPSDPNAEERAGKLRNQAVSDFTAGRYADAANRFREAWELGHDFVDVCNLGVAELDLGRSREAAEHLGICLKVMPGSQKPAFGERFERFLREARSKVAALSIMASVPGAGVVVDDRPVRKLPLDGPIFVDPGSHKVRVSAPGYEDSAREVQVAAGESMTWDVDLKPAAPEQRKPGTSENTVMPVAAPLKVTGSPASGGAPRGQEGRSSPPANGASSVLLGIGAGTGILGFAIGSGFLAASLKDRFTVRKLALDIAKGYRPPDCVDVDVSGCEYMEDLSDRADVSMAVGIAGLVIGAVGGTLAFRELIELGAEPRAEGVQAAFVVTPGGGALVLKGRF